MPAFNRKVYLNSMKSVLVEHPSNANTDSVDNDKDNNQNHGSSSNKYVYHSNILGSRLFRKVAEEK